jgi:hypothetical protein
MKILEGKSPAEKNKIILAIVLGALALLSLVYTFGGSFFGGSKKTVNVSISPTPTATATPAGNAPLTAVPPLPNQNEINSQWTVTPVVYNPGSFYAPDAGRNIFAFYEPPARTPFDPSLIPTKTPTPTPTLPPPPEPNVIVSFITPQSVYAGSRAFRLEINGDKFTPETFIFWNGSQLPTNFISAQKLTADIPANLIASESTVQLEVRSPDGKLFARPSQITVQAAPRPQFQYIGMIARRSGNNDTAYLQEQGKPTPFGARLNDVVGGRFRVISISASEILVEDTMLGFRHRVPLTRADSGQTGNPNQRGSQPPGFPPNSNFQPYNNPSTQPQEIPGIPSNIPRYVPPQPQQSPPPQKKDDDEDDDGDGF